MAKVKKAKKAKRTQRSMRVKHSKADLKRMQVLRDAVLKRIEELGTTRKDFAFGAKLGYTHFIGFLNRDHPPDRKSVV